MSGISDYLKSEREKAGLSVAQAAREAGISAPYLYQIEYGQRNASAKVLSRLARVYHVRVDELLVKADLLPAPAISGTDAESRESRIKRAFDYVMRDPSFRAGSDAMGGLPAEAKLLIVRLYERAEGLRILPEDLL